MLHLNSAARDVVQMLLAHEQTRENAFTSCCANYGSIQSTASRRWLKACLNLLGDMRRYAETGCLAILKRELRLSQNDRELMTPSSYPAMQLAGISQGKDAASNGDKRLVITSRWKVVDELVTSPALSNSFARYLGDDGKGNLRGYRYV
jgi:hypothetical protein